MKRSASFQPSLEALEVRTVPSTIPLLSSLPSATASVYLDFDGHYESQWGSYRNVTTPAFDLDGVAGFSGTEQEAMVEIWKRVAEAYSPFNVNVTTVNPNNFTDRVGLRVAIGGSSLDWYASPAGGVAFRNAFTNSSLVNTVYVFAQSLGNSPKNIALAAAHEAGHAFGLQHHPAYDGAGRVTEEYSRGDADRGPIMGAPYGAARALWWYDSRIGQDDLATLGSVLGLREDGVGHSLSTATKWGTATRFSGSGIIVKQDRADYYTFDTGGGDLALRVNVASVGPTLDAQVQLLDWWGNVVASADPSDRLDASLSVSGLAAGRYYVKVSSHGGFGDVGTYTIDGSLANLSYRSLQVANAGADPRMYVLTNQGQLWTIAQTGGRTLLANAVLSTALAPNGTLFVQEHSGMLSSWTPTAGWRPLTTSAQSFGLAPDGTLFVQERSGMLYSWTAAVGWRGLTTSAQSFGLAPDGTLFVQERSGMLYSWTATVGWRALTTSAQSFAIAKDGTLFVQEWSGMLYSWTATAGWRALTTSAQSFGLAPDGTLFVQERSGMLYSWTATAGWRGLTTSAQSFAVAPDGMLYVLERSGVFYSWTGAAGWRLIELGVSSFFIDSDGSIRKTYR